MSQDSNILHNKIHGVAFIFKLCNSISPIFAPLDISEEQIKLLRDKLMSNPCRNQGYVLDDFPNTYEQANDLFGGERGTYCFHMQKYSYPLNVFVFGLHYKRKTAMYLPGI